MRLREFIWNLYPQTNELIYYINSLAKVKDKEQILRGQTIVKSISEKKWEKKLITTNYKIAGLQY